MFLLSNVKKLYKEGVTREAVSSEGSAGLPAADGRNTPGCGNAESRVGGCSQGLAVAVSSHLQVEIQGKIDFLQPWLS